MLNIYTKEPNIPAQACVIWLHGLGANGDDMRGVVDVFPLMDRPIRHVFVDAPVRPVTLNNRIPMRAWYDLTGLTLQDRDDREGILQSEHALQELITMQISKGLQAHQIYIAGFSQGGAMALFVGLRTQWQLGGIIALSAYLPLHQECLGTQHLSLPIFMAKGLEDAVVLPSWTNLAYDFIQSQGLTRVICKDYPMEHTICLEEIKDMADWLETQVEQGARQGEMR